MIIPYALTYRSTVTGSAIKKVSCEGCGAQYGYRLMRTMIGRGTSLFFLDNRGASARAAMRAGKALGEALERDVDAVPCPACGHYQGDMLPILRERHERWMRPVGRGLLLASPFVFLIAVLVGAKSSGMGPMPWTSILSVTTAVAGLGVALIIGRRILASQYDPNGDDVDARKQSGQARVADRMEFEAELERAGKTLAQGVAQSRQLVGDSCVVCGKRIVAAIQATRCARCRSAVHHACLVASSSPAAEPRCGRCRSS